MNNMKSVYSYVMEKWKEHHNIVLDTSGGWHTCNSEKCNIQHVQAQICTHGQLHARSESTCTGHPVCCIKNVNNLYVCMDTGKFHVCEATANTCAVKNGRCTISGATVTVHSDNGLNNACLPSTNRRCKRRKCTTHTNYHSACIILFDLLFSVRRIKYENVRATTYYDMSRRQTQKLCRDFLKSRRPLVTSQLVDIYMKNREILRPACYLANYATREKKNGNMPQIRQNCGESVGRSLY